MARSRGRRGASGEEPNRVLGFPLRGALGGQAGEGARRDDESAAAGDSAQPQAGRGAASGNDAEPQRVLGIPLSWFTALGRTRSS
jgi:hypothetical protein